MARLTSIYRTEEENYVNVGRRQLPVVAGDNLVMLMDLNSKGLCIDSPHIRGKELEEFSRKFRLLTTEELHQCLEIDNATFISVLNQCVQCVGCRRRVERLFYQLTLSGHPTLDPLVLKNSCILTIAEEKLKTPQALGTVLYRHHDVLNNLLDYKLRNKTRCVLHSLDAFRLKPFSETWREVWSSMKHNCRDELAVIETKELHEVLENYLKKHKFCQGCRTKIEKAYKILVGESNAKEKGFVAALYANIKKCQHDKHIHVVTNKVDFLDALIRRAEPEVNGSYSKQRERHAKTLEIAQEEVLTCVGMIMYERLRRIYVSLREEERACQVLAAVGVHALCRSFDMFVEQKQGISNLELLYQEMSRAEKAKEHKREQKKLKKKLKKTEKRNAHRACVVAEDTDAGSETAEADEEEEEPEVVEVDADVDEAVDVGDDADDEDFDVLPTANIELEIVPVEPLKTNTNNNNNNKRTKSSKQKQKQPQKGNNNNNNNNNNNRKNSKKQQRQKASSMRSRSSSSSNNTSLSSSSTMAVQAGEKCNDCLAPVGDCPCEADVKDSGYGSEPHTRDNSRTSSVVCSPEGSEVCCSDGFCNHEHEQEPANGLGHGHGHEHDVHDHLTYDERCGNPMCKEQRMQILSLQQMLDDSEEYENDDEDNCYIPKEVVLEYQCQREKVQQQRQKLRETLKENFARLCMQRQAKTLSACE